jgi:hypothetical protein
MMKAENRCYDDDAICTTRLRICPDNQLFVFGIRKGNKRALKLSTFPKAMMAMILKMMLMRKKREKVHTQDG